MNLALLQRRMKKFFEKTTPEQLADQLDKVVDEREKRSNCTACFMEKTGVKSRRRLPHSCGK